MAGLIPQSFIDNLLDRVDIVEVVDHRVKLKKTGKNYSACCPFHDEKTPSFTVSPDKQFYYCFGCGASGNALGFIMDFERLSFPEATEQLARLAGLEVPREVQTEAQEKREQEKKSIYSLLQKTSEFYQLQLRQHLSKQMAVNYLKGRGLDGKTAKAYGVGFAPPGWDNLLKTLATSDEDKHLLIEGGMLIHHEQDKKLYDRFRHRIMFPIHDTRGRVIGFGGRVLGDDKPKYLNSPETPVFHKGQELYGLYEARLAYRELPRLLVVEGYMDVVSLAQFGIRYGVATLGTACGEDHLDRAFKYTNEVVFCFDGDKAGRTAAHRALEASLSTMIDGRTVKFLFLPDGEDPDTLVRQIGPEKFERMIDMAVPLEDFLFDAVAEGLNIRTMEGRATFSKRAAPLLDKLPKGVFRELMFENLASRTGLSRAILQDLVTEPVTFAEPAPAIIERRDNTLPPHFSIAQSDYDHADVAGYYDQEAPPTDYDERYTGRPAYNISRQQPLPHGQSNDGNRYRMLPAQKAIALLITHPKLAAEAPEHDSWLQDTDPDLQMLGKLLKLLHERPHYTSVTHILTSWFGKDEYHQLVKSAGNEFLQAAIALSLSRDDKPAKADYDTVAAFTGCLQTLVRQQEEKINAQAVAKLKSAGFNDESKKHALEILARKKQPKPQSE